MPNQPVFAPDGSIRDIPEDQVQAALSAGGKVAVRMKDPHGTLRYVPQDSVEQAKQAGGTLADDPTPHETGVWAGIKRGVSNLASLPGQVYHAVADEPRDATEQFTSDRGGRLAVAAKRLLLDPQLEQERKAQEYYSQAKGDPDSQAAHMGNMHRIAAAVPVVGPIAGELTDRYLKGDKGGALAEGATYIAAPKVAEKVISGVKAVPEAARGAMAERMQQPVEAGGPTRMEVLDAARAKGVNLDLAQATDSGVAQGAKRANRYSLASQGTYDAAATKNVQALEQWADTEQAKYSPEGGGREVVGPKMQEALKNDLVRKKAASTDLFDKLDQKVGGAPQDVSNTIAAEAQKIIGENAEYYAKHPELKPGKAWAILEDLASKTPGKAVAKAVGGSEVIDAGGNPIMQKGPAGGPKMATWSELHQLRSDLMDFYRNNPDIVKGRSEAWIQQMVSKVDESLTQGASGLSPADLADFRKANSVWESIKSTYDNPQSPYYHAVRSNTPSQIPGMLSKSSPELARSVRQTLGSLEGPFQRQFVENLLNGKDGSLDLKNLNSRLSRVPQDLMVSMLGEDGARNFRMLGRVASKVTADANPSGTAKVGVPAAEVTGVFNNPVAGVAELGTQYAAARAMNSPKVVDYLTRKKK